MKSELVPLNGGSPIPILKDVTVVGRREFCDVLIDDPSLSKRHAVLVRTDGLLMVRDLASTNGTKVNGQRVMWAALLPNDRLTLGRCKFKVYLGSDEALSPSEKVLPGTHTPVLREKPWPMAAAASKNRVAGSSPAQGTTAPRGKPAQTVTSADDEPAFLGEFVIDDDDEDAIVIDLE